MGPVTARGGQCQAGGCHSENDGKGPAAYENVPARPSAAPGTYGREVGNGRTRMRTGGESLRKRVPVSGHDAHHQSSHEKTAWSRPSPTTVTVSVQSR